MKRMKNLVLGVVGGLMLTGVGGCDVDELPFRAPPMSSVTIGELHSCALSESGAGYCWGDGGSGQLGTGERQPSNFAARVRSDLQFTSMDAGGRHTCAVTDGGELYCWGANDVGQLGTGSRERALEPRRVATDERFISVSAGWTHTCAVSTAGRVFCWGDGAAGQLGTGSIEFSADAPVAVAADLTFREVSAGGRHTCGVTADGDAYCWGANEYAQLGIGTSGSPVLLPTRVITEVKFRQVSAGWNHTCGAGVDANGYCWGENGYGEMGSGWAAPIGVPAQPVPSPVANYGEIRYVQLSAGKSFTCGLRDQGSVYCWGRGEYGQLGNANVMDNINPQWVHPGPGRERVTRSDLFRKIDAGGNAHVCGAGQNGRVFCWGNGEYGQLGTGERFSAVPFPVMHTR